MNPQKRAIAEINKKDITEGKADVNEGVLNLKCIFCTDGFHKAIIITTRAGAAIENTMRIQELSDKVNMFGITPAIW